MILGRTLGIGGRRKHRLNLDGGLWLQPVGERVPQSSNVGMGEGGGNVPMRQGINHPAQGIAF